jgi:hypothetical protein
MSDSTLQAKGNAIYRETATDLSTAIGKLVTFSAGAPSVNASATVPAVGIVRAVISASSAALSFGDTVQQAADGTLTKDLGAGNNRVVVGVVSDMNGAVAGDECEVTLFTPQIRT